NPGAISGNQICECVPDDLPDFAGDSADDEDMYEIQAERNAEFIASARTGYPAALEALSEARGQIAELREAMQDAHDLLDDALTGNLSGWPIGEVIAAVDKAMRKLGAALTPAPGEGQ